MVVFYVSGRSGLEKKLKNVLLVQTKLLSWWTNTVVLSAEPVFIHKGFRKGDLFLW